MLVGDAAHQINPMTGGGIASGVRWGQIAGEVAIKALEKGDYSENMLKLYPKKIFTVFGKTHERFYRIKESINQLTDDELTYIAKQVSTIPSDKVGLSDVFKSAVYKKPSLIIDVLKVFAGI